MSAEVQKPDLKKKKTTASKEKSIQTGRDYKTVEVSKEDLTSEGIFYNSVLKMNLKNCLN